MLWLCSALFMLVRSEASIRRKATAWLLTFKRPRHYKSRGSEPKGARSQALACDGTTNSLPNLCSYPAGLTRLLIFAIKKGLLVFVQHDFQSCISRVFVGFRGGHSGALCPLSRGSVPSRRGFYAPMAGVLCPIFTGVLCPVMHE